MENPVVEAPQGEIMQGQAMDIMEDKGVKKEDKEEGEDEEPEIGPATNQ